MEKRESKFSDSQKLSIKTAIWRVYELRSFLSSSEEYEEQLCDSLETFFPSHDCVHNMLVETYTPDIVIRDVGVIEVKCLRWANIDSTRKGRIETYMKALSMPGLMVNFPHRGFPYLRWFYLDEKMEPQRECYEILKSAHWKLNLDGKMKQQCECYETLESDPSPLTDQALSNYSNRSNSGWSSADQALSNYSNRSNSGWSSADQALSNYSNRSNSGWSSASQALSNRSNSEWSDVGKAIGIGLGIAAAAVAVGFAVSNYGKEKKKSTDDESK